jgi:two-component system chemotaxis response regulator CheY
MANIMIVDDSMFMRGIVKRFVGTAHHVVAEAANGLEAVRMYAEFKPDILCMDITMPKMNGIDALKYIMEIDPQAKVIMCSAIGQEWAIQKAMQLGAKAFLIKPYAKEDLLAVLDDVLEDKITP